MTWNPNFTPISEMSLDEMYIEQVGLSYWGEVLEDTQPEVTQARIDELSREIERREETLFSSPSREDQYGPSNT